MGLRGNGTIPAVWSARLRLAKHAGMQIMELVKKDIKPRDIMTPAAFHNAETVDMALGCSTNTMLHLPAIAHECGIELDLDMSNDISAHTPNLCHLAPAGDTYMEDLEGAGGVYAVMKELTKRDLLDTSVMTVTGKTMAENLEGVVNRDPQLIHRRYLCRQDRGRGCGGYPLRGAEGRPWHAGDAQPHLRHRGYGP